MSHETSGPIPGGRRASDFFSERLREHMLSSERSATRRFNRVFSSSSCRRRRSSLTPRCAYVFSRRRKFARRFRAADRHPQSRCQTRPAGEHRPSVLLFFRKLRPLHRSAPFVEDRRRCQSTLVLSCRRFRGRRHHRSIRSVVYIVRKL